MYDSAHVSLLQLMFDAHKNAVEKGFWNKAQEPLESLMLIVTELSEAVEEIRSHRKLTETYYEYPQVDGSVSVSNLPYIEVSELQMEFDLSGTYPTTKRQLGKPCGVPSELADTIIRICDFASYHNIDLEGAIIEKMNYNKTRPKMHGKII